MAIYNDIEEKMRKLPLQDLLCLQKDLEEMIKERQAEPEKS